MNFPTKYQDMKNEYDWKTIYNKPIKITSRIKEHSFYNQLNNGVIFYEYKFYFYENFGIFPKGGSDRFYVASDETMVCKP